MNFGTPLKPLLSGILNGLWLAPWTLQAGLLEPPVMFYGQVTPASPAPDLSTVTFTFAGNAETLTTAAPARVVSIEGTRWFIVSIPFESRTVQGGPALAASPGRPA